MEEDVSASAAN